VLSGAAPWVTLRLEEALMDTTEQPAPSAAPLPSTRRLYLGAGVFVLGWLVTFALIPLINAGTLGLSTKATLVTALVLGGPKLGLLVAIVIMGRPGFVHLKTLIFGYLRPPSEVSTLRHRIGVAMLVAAMIWSALEPYVFALLPSYKEHGRLYSLAVDMMMLGSIFVLGGDFWDKLRALFIRDAKALFPQQSS
jgi:hypothetical protein